MEQNMQSSENNPEIKLDGEGEPIHFSPKKNLSKKMVALVLSLVILIIVGVIYFMFFNKDNNDQIMPVENTEIMESKEVDKNLDSDQDKLPDYFEKILGTDENNPDTDGDNYSDFDEIKNGYNPLTDKKFTDEEWYNVKEKIRGEDEGFYERIFVGNLLEKRDVLTMAGFKEYASRLVEEMIEYDATTNSLATYDTILVTSDFPDDVENKIIENFTAFKIRKTAKEVTQEDRDLNNFFIIGNPDINDFLREIYNKTVVVDIANERDLNVNKSVMKFAINPWNKDRTISIYETNYSHGEVINTRGRIIVGKVDNFYHIVINTDENESYALVASFGIKDDNLVQFDGKNVEITGYKRINNSSKIQFEDSIGVIDIEVVD